MCGLSFVKETNLTAFFCKSNHAVEETYSLGFAMEGYPTADAVDLILINVDSLVVRDYIISNGERGVFFLAADGCEGEHCEECHEFSGLVLHFLLMLRGFY